MPLYDYKNTETGERDVRFNHYENRDSEPWPWKRVPSRICLPGTAIDRPPTEAEGFLKDLYNQEQSEGTEFKGICEFSKQQLKEIWTDDRPVPEYEDYVKKEQELADPDRGKKLYFT